MATTTGNKYQSFSNGALLCLEVFGKTPAEGDGVKFMWIPEKMAFRAGRTSDAEILGVVGFLAKAAWDDANIGTGSVAFGINTEASTRTAMAFGVNTASKGLGSLAGGFGSRTTGQYSFLLGHDSITGDDPSAPFAGGFSLNIGHDVQVKKQYSFALGDALRIEGNAFHAFAFGKDHIVRSHNSGVFGLKNQIDGDSPFTFATGTQNYIAGGSHGSYIFGEQNIIGDLSNVISSPGGIDFNTLTLADLLPGYSHYSFIAGYRSYVKKTSPYSVIIGGDVSSIGDNSIFAYLRGCGNKIIDSPFSDLTGSGSKLINSPAAKAETHTSIVTNSRHAYARGTGVTINNSPMTMAFGDNVTVDNSTGPLASRSFAFGLDVTIRADSGISSSTSFAFGQTVLIKKAISSFAFGSNIEVEGNYSFASGLGSRAKGFANIAMGSFAAAFGDMSIALGANTEAGNEGTDNTGVAIGNFSKAKSENSFAFGANVQASADNAMVIGVNPVTPLINAIPNSLKIGFNSTNATLFVGNNSASRVGVNTDTPEVDLHVAGNAKVEGYVEVKKGSVVPPTPTAANVGRIYFDGSDLFWKSMAGTFSLTNNSGGGGGGSFIPTSEKGAANGVATLGSDGKVPEGQLPDILLKDSKSITIQSPTGTEFVPLFFTSQIIKIRAIYIQTDVASVSVGVFVKDHINSTPESPVLDGTGYTSGSAALVKKVDANFTTAKVVAEDKLIVLRTNAITGTPTKLHVTVAYEVS